LKDLQQAICTSVIVDKKEIHNLFTKLPKKWQQAVSDELDRAKKELILYRNEITDLENTLQIEK